MAKNIADTTRLIEQNAQYDIGSNIVNRTPGGYGEQVLLSDLQLITLKRGDDNKFSLDADGDGLIDGRELGSEDGPTTSLKISGFIKKMLKAEAGDSYSSATDPDYMYNMYKANIQAAATAADNAENKGNIVTPGREKEKFIQTQHDIRVVGDDIYVDVMSYTSNPILKDSDFDGVWDGHGKEDEAHKNQYKDNKPLDNTVAGKITMTNGNDLDVRTNMDYRYFFMDKYNYYDELAVMSLILSNAVYGKNTSNLSNIGTINEKIGLNLDYRTVEESDVKPRKYTYKTKYAIGNKSIEYSKDNSATNMIKKRVIPIIIPGMYSDLAYGDSDGRSYSEIGERDWLKNNSDHGEESHNVMSYEIYADAILHDIDEYERNSHDNIPGDKAEEKKVYWVMGYKEGGAIANILASKLIDQAKDVYAYTFASPYTLYNNIDAVGETDKLRQPISRTGYLARYDSIFNVVNEVDAYAFVMPQRLGFSRYGMTCFGGYSVYNPTTNRFEMDKESVYKILDELENLYKGNNGLTRVKTYEKDTNPNKNQNYAGLYNVYQRLIRAIDIDRNHKEATATGTADRQNNIDTLQEFYKRYRNVPDLATFINTLEVNYDKVKRAGQEDQYYNIAKNMQNADIVNVVNLYDNRKKVRKATGSDTLYFTAIEDMSKWYVDNVATYQTRLQTETVASLNNYNTKLNYIREYKLKNSAKVESSYKVATNNQENAVAKSTYSNATPILKATENAVNNYKTNYSQIKFSNLAYYPCSDIDTGTDTYKKAGDDCVRFAFACFKKMDSNFISNLETYSGLTWDNINSTRLAGKDGKPLNNDKIASAMTKLGFEIYDTDGDDKPVDYDKDNIDDYEIKSIPSNFYLQAGDFVACSGHVHFCLEDDNDSRSNTDKDNFGWGSVYREYPKHYKFKVESAGNNKYYVVSSGHKFTRVYRYTK